MSDNAVAITLIESEISSLVAQQDALRAQVASLDAPITALRRVLRGLGAGPDRAETIPQPEAGAPEKKVRHKPDEPLLIPGTEVPARTPLDIAEALEALEREGR